MFTDRGWLCGRELYLIFALQVIEVGCVALLAGCQEGKRADFPSLLLLLTALVLCLSYCCLLVGLCKAPCWREHVHTG